MENVLSCTGYIQQNTVISNVFIEHFMLDANGSYVKVYLYLSKCIQSGGIDISIPFLADKQTALKEILFVLCSIGEKRDL